MRVFQRFFVGSFAPKKTKEHWVEHVLFDCNMFFQLDRNDQIEKTTLNIYC